MSLSYSLVFSDTHATLYKDRSVSNVCAVFPVFLLMVLMTGLLISQQHGNRFFEVAPLPCHINNNLYYLLYLDILYQLNWKMSYFICKVNQKKFSVHESKQNICSSNPDFKTK